MGDDRGISEEEFAGGGTDVLSTCPPSASRADHLVVMVHGILGSMADWKFAAEEFVEALPAEVIVHCSERNMYGLTLDGVDVMGERLAQEVVDVINNRPELCRISFVAHSLGGLVARYAIGRLYRPPRRKLENEALDGETCNGSSEGTICGLKAMNFITVATPHLGSRGNKQVPFLFGLMPVERVASRVIHWIFRRTGRHLFLTDNDGGKPPLLLQMIDDCGDLKFISALGAFRRRVVYANVGYDHVVGWKTSSIRRASKLPKWEDCLSKKYPHIVHEEKSEGRSDDDLNNCDDHERDVGNDADDYDMLEEELVTGLSRLSWERVDVSFHDSMFRFAAHSIIQVKDSLLHSDGADVVRHMIDHFHT